MKKQFLKKWGTFMVSCVLYVATCLFLYIIQYPLYGNVIKTPLLYVIVFPVLAWLGWIINGGYPKTDRSDQEHQLLESGIKLSKDDAGETKKRIGKTHRISEFFIWWHSKNVSAGQKISVLVSTFIIVAASFFMIYALVVNPFTLMVYFYFGVLGILGLMTFCKTMSQWRISVMACFIFLMMIIVVLIYLLIVSPMTVKSGRDLLEQSGYENIYYEKSVADDALIRKIFDNDPQYQSKNADGLGFYLFRCEKNGEAMGAAVSVVDQNIVAVESLNNDSGLSFFMNFD